MDIAFTNIPAASDTTLSWSAHYTYEQVLSAFQMAVQRVQERQQRLFVSITLPVSSCEPVTMFKAFGQLSQDNRFFWSRVSDQRALVGSGETMTIETAAHEPITKATTVWNALCKDALQIKLSEHIPHYTEGPLLFGGFAFDPYNPPTATWADFPTGLLILPHLLFHSDDEYAAITLNTFVETDDIVEQRTKTFIAYLAKLQNLLQSRSSLPNVPTATAMTQLHVQDSIPQEAWCAKVQTIIDCIQRGEFDKAVMARSVQIHREDNQQLDIPATLQRLRQSYPEAYVFAIQRHTHYFIGATPERLVCSADGQIQTMALAGSAPRGRTAAEDQRLGDELLRSNKNQGEHHVVVETIQRSLAPICSRVWTAAAPRLLKLKNIQHLETPLMGDLKTGHSLLEVIEKLHPTPAVGGYPRQAALSAIRTHEQLDRGWYAGPVGWLGGGGNGEFAVALRSALVYGSSATLFAGCGIVASSDPQSEYQESNWKLQVMLRGLGGEEKDE